VCKIVGHVLATHGFVVASSGSGTVEFERDGEIGEEEIASLKSKMADELFDFDQYDETEFDDEE
jgi:hypothetical protein